MKNENGVVSELKVDDVLGPDVLPNWSGAKVRIVAVGDGPEVGWPLLQGVLVRIGTQSRTDHTGYDLNTGDGPEADAAAAARLDLEVGMILDMGNGIERVVVGSWPPAQK